MKIINDVHRVYFVHTHYQIAFKSYWAISICKHYFCDKKIINHSMRATFGWGNVKLWGNFSTARLKTIMKWFPGRTYYRILPVPFLGSISSSCFAVYYLTKKYHTPTQPTLIVCFENSHPNWQQNIQSPPSRARYHCTSNRFHLLLFCYWCFWLHDHRRLGLEIQRCYPWTNWWLFWLENRCWRLLYWYLSHCSRYISHIIGTSRLRCPALLRSCQGRICLS